MVCQSMGGVPRPQFLYCSLSMYDNDNCLKEKYDMVNQGPRYGLIPRGAVSLKVREFEVILRTTAVMFRAEEHLQYNISLFQNIRYHGY